MEEKTIKRQGVWILKAKHRTNVMFLNGKRKQEGVEGGQLSSSTLALIWTETGRVEGGRERESGVGEGWRESEKWFK